MERAIYIVGAVLGSLYTITLLPSYGTDGLVDRSFTACVMLLSGLCLLGIFRPLLPSKRND